MNKPTGSSHLRSLLNSTARPGLLSNLHQSSSLSQLRYSFTSNNLTYGQRDALYKRCNGLWPFCWPLALLQKMRLDEPTLVQKERKPLHSHAFLLFGMSRTDSFLNFICRRSRAPSASLAVVDSFRIGASVLRRKGMGAL